MTDSSAPTAASRAAKLPTTSSGSHETRSQRFVGPYLLLERLGSGGMGHVFLAQDEAGRRVAIKVLAAQLDDETILRRFEREGRFLAELQHPCIVRTLGRGIDKETQRPYLAMEVVYGRDLGQILQDRGEGRLSISEAAYVLERTARALAAAHAQGVIHRDVKPANLLLTPAGQVKLTDFGIALSQDVSVRLTMEAEILGTPSFVAPEVLVGEAWTPSADMYALGSLGFRLLSGRPLFEGQSITEILTRSLTETPPRLAELCPEVPEALTGLIDRLLSKEQPERPTPEQVLNELAELMPVPEQLEALWKEATPRDDQGKRMPLPHELTLAQGQVFDNYRIEKELGRGGMGIVYRAYHVGLKKTVALKILLSGALAGEAERQRFLREAQAASLLKHPYVVPVLDAGCYEGTYFLTMELVEGQPLGDYVQAEERPRETLIELFNRIGEGVHHAHTRGVIHRDLKPDNILISPDGAPHILDFGLAKQLDQEESDSSGGLTTEGDIVGTLKYMPPEQAAGKLQEVDVRSDVYALGTILYELVCGRTPFRGSMRELLHQIHFSEPSAPSSHSADLPWELDAICLKALEKERNDRYQSALELSRDLERYLAGLPITARRATLLYRARKWALRNKGLVAVGAVAALLIVSILTLLGLRELRERRAQERAVVEGTIAAWEDFAADRLEEAIEGFTAARHRAGPDTVFRLPAATVTLFPPGVREELEAAERSQPRVSASRLRAWVLVAQARLDGAEVRRLLGDARASLERGELEAAAESTRLVLRLSPGEEQALALQGGIAASFLERARGHLGAAQGAGELATRDEALSAAAAELEAAQKIDPGHSGLLEAVVAVRREREAFEERERRARDRAQARALVETGRRQLEAGELEASRQAFLQALGFDPGSEPAREGQLEVELELAKAQEAQAKARRRAEDRRRAAERVSEGQAALDRDDVEEARAQFLQALAFEGSNQAAQEGLVTCTRREVARRRAEEEARRAEAERAAARARQEQVRELIAQAEASWQAARAAFRAGELPEVVRDHYTAAMDGLREALYLVPKHPQASELNTQVAREFAVVLVEHGLPELAEFIKKAGRVDPDEAAAELPSDPHLRLVEAEKVNIERAFGGQVHFLPSRAFESLRKYLVSQTERYCFVLEVRSSLRKEGSHPQVFATGIRIRMEDTEAGTVSSPVTVRFEDGPFLRPVMVNAQGVRLVRPFDQAQRLDAKRYIKEVEAIVQRMLRDAK